MSGVKYRRKSALCGPACGTFRQYFPVRRNTILRPFLPIKSLRALDLYSGIGGWSLGLRAAGLDVAGSYELWPEAVATYNANLSTKRSPTDIRTLDLRTLPKRIDLVVGSPPCTEFSFSNKGGRGDIDEGFKDIVRFFEIVERVRPKYWILENVPRTAALIEQGLKTARHPLFRFRKLRPAFRIFDFSEFGLPQCRRRCLAGDFPFDLLDSYRRISKKLSLRDIILSLSARGEVSDPIWGQTIRREVLTETEPEPPLNNEQLRINREAKQYHPVYNDMAFPDRLDVPARTVTATCTRVSRESIVISDPKTAQLRRLTVRERASLQSFPIGFQLFAGSHSSKVKMVGNAFPPLVSLFVGMASRQVGCAAAARSFGSAAGRIGALTSVLPAPSTPPHNTAEIYPRNRRFRAALLGLRFKSGMRFELANDFKGKRVRWRVRFFYGPSKAVKTIRLDKSLLHWIARHNSMRAAMPAIELRLSAIRHAIASTNARTLQDCWTRRSTGPGPYQTADLLGSIATSVADHLHGITDDELAQIALHRCNTASCVKFVQNAKALVSGFIVGCFFNQEISGSGEIFPQNRPISGDGLVPHRWQRSSSQFSEVRDFPPSVTEGESARRGWIGDGV